MSDTEQQSQTGNVLTFPAMQSDAVPQTVEPLRAYFEVKENGVWHVPVVREKNTGSEHHGAPHWICSPLLITGRARNEDSESWGRVLEFSDAAGVSKRWAMPMSMLSGDGSELRATLLDMGLEISASPLARKLLCDYIQTEGNRELVYCTDRIGWLGNSYLLPRETIGDARVIFQSESTYHDGFRKRGNAQAWRETISAWCVGNSRLTLAVCSALAAPLMAFANTESGGFHLRGHSSRGKTTVMRAAASVWGAAEFVKTWRSTANGLEGVAVTRNDNLLILDELGMTDGKLAEESVYMLANGQSKNRARASGLARKPKTWRLMLLSTGEISLSDLISAAGKRSRAGHEVRFVDVPAEVAEGTLFETLHHFDGGAALCGAISETVELHSGHAGPAFVAILLADRERHAQWLSGQRAALLREWLPGDVDGQVTRVAERFILCALAGELASAEGLTGWPKGAAVTACKRCFDAWLEQRGGTASHETRAALQQVAKFFELHGSSRFENLNSTDKDQRIFNRVGYRRERENDGQDEYLFLPEAYKSELCAGLDPRAVTRALLEAGWLVPASNGKAQRCERLPDLGPAKVYVIRPVIGATDA